MTGSERITDDKVEKALKCCEGEYSTNCKECYYLESNLIPRVLRVDRNCQQRRGGTVASSK